jgi:hypothetical protein
MCSIWGVVAMRFYDEPVEVRHQPAGPVAFLWRDRLYVVRRVLDRWRERDAWWRHLDRLDDLAERQVWRVEAGRGRLAGVGVFDLAEQVGVGQRVLHPVPAGPVRPAAVDEPVSGVRWRLLRAAD